MKKLVLKMMTQQKVRRFCVYRGYYPGSLLLSAIRRKIMGNATNSAMAVRIQEMG